MRIYNQFLKFLKCLTAFNELLDLRQVFFDNRVRLYRRQRQDLASYRLYAKCAYGDKAILRDKANEVWIFWAVRQNVVYECLLGGKEM